MDHWTAFKTELGVCGWIALTWNERGLRTLKFLEEDPGLETEALPPWVAEAVERLKAFLAGHGNALQGIPLDLEGLSPFHQRVYEVLLATLPGQTLSYGEVALLAGSPGAARAVGQAVARNPLPLLVPCHRVLAANGPGGFSLFGNLQAKARLLALEGVLLPC
ncbi:MAG: cysteine methyltransferase [Holophagaceae bacterium]|nr:cysteine methyltransferase [Holophagaceae bacterium]